MNSANRTGFKPPVSQIYNIGDNRLPGGTVLPPPPDVYEPRTVTVEFNDDDLPPEPRAPDRPKQHGAWCRMRHPEKHLQDQAKYDRQVLEWQANHANWVAQKESRRVRQVVVPPPPRPQVEVSKEERAYTDLQKEIITWGTRLGDQRQKVVAATQACEAAKAAAKRCFGEKNQQELANTHVKDYVSARKTLRGASRTYCAYTDKVEYYVKLLEEYKQSLLDKHMTELAETLKLATMENQEEVDAIQRGLNLFAVPQTGPQTVSDAEEIEAIKREFAAEAAAEMRDKLGVTGEEVPQRTEPVLQPRMPLAV